MYNTELRDMIVSELRTNSVSDTVRDILALIREEIYGSDFRKACLYGVLDSISEREAQGMRTVHMKDDSLVDGYASEEDAQWGLLYDDMCALSQHMQELDAPEEPRRSTRVAFPGK